MTSTQQAARQQKQKRQHDADTGDIGKILKELANSDEKDPIKITEKYITSDLSHIKDNIDKIKITLPKLPELAILSGSNIFRGGSAIVFETCNADIKTLKYALKIFRPSILSNKNLFSELSAEYNKARLEFINHAPLSDKNIARFLGFSDVQIRVPGGHPINTFAFLTEWIDDAKPLNDFLLEGRLHYSEVIAILRQCFSGLHALHVSNLVHWDIKSENFLVDSRKTPKLMDIGNASFREKPEDTSWQDDGRRLTTRGNQPCSLQEIPAADEFSQSSRRIAVKPTNTDWDTPWLDLWMLARELNELFGAVGRPCAERDLALLVDIPSSDASERFLSASFPSEDEGAQFVLRAIRLTLARLLRPEGPSEPRYYDSAQQVADDLGKLEPEFGAAQGVKELAAIPQRNVRLPVSGNAPYTKRLGILLNCVPVQRLDRHLQLGSNMHVYPGATHRRFEHTVGVVAAVCEFVRALYSDTTNPLWRLTIEEHDIDALLVAAVVHDLGHIAYGHVLEELGGLFHAQTHEDYVLAVLDSSRLQSRPRGSGVPDSLTADAIAEDRRALRDALQEFCASAAASAGADSVMKAAAGILDEGLPQAKFAAASVLRKDETDKIKQAILRSILSSPIDADKFDYLLRDAHHCGVEYAKGIDRDRFFQSLTVFPQVDFRDNALASSAPDNISTGGSAERSKEDESRVPASIGVTKKGVLPVETILAARYQMFRSVYWHHTNRALSAMLHFAVIEYVGASQSLAQARLAGLTTEFRKRNDEAAVKWLLRQMDEVPDLEIELETKAKIKHACLALLGNREFLYKRVFELRYERSNINRDTKNAADLFRRLMRIWSSITKEQDERKYVDGVRQLHRDFSVKVSNQLCLPQMRFARGDLLLDIPPEGKDQIENVLVLQRRGTKLIEDTSPIANALKDAFEHWARIIRVFASPSVMSTTSDKERLKSACWTALQEIALERLPQWELDLDGP